MFRVCHTGKITGMRGDQMGEEEKEVEQTELLRAVYEQHWLHARHVENERLWFTNIFGVVVAGLLAFMFTLENNGTPNLFGVYGGLFIFVMSLLGYFLCLSWRAPFIEHTTLPVLILKDKELNNYAPYNTEAFRKIKPGWISSHELFLYFYGFMAAGGLCITLQTGLKWPYWWLGILVGVILCLLWRLLLRKREVYYRRKRGITEM